MLKLISGLLKLGIFSILILVLGHYIHWDGRSASEHVKKHLSHAETSGLARDFKNFAGSLIDDARQGHARRFASEGVKTSGETARGTVKNGDEISISSAAPTRQTIKAEPAPTDSIAVSERQKLRALIRELNRQN